MIHLRGLQQAVRLGLRTAALPLLAALAVGSSLGGCARDDALSGTIYIYVGLSNDKLIGSQPNDNLRSLLNDFLREFKLLNPRVGVQLLFFPEANLSDEITRRNRSGLGPDLVIVNGSTAITLANRGLTRVADIDPKVANQIAPSVSQNFQKSKGWIGLPVVSQPQVACFNRSLMAQPPATIAELLQASAKGQPLGLSLEPVDLYWSAGSLGAAPALNKLVIRGGNPAERSLSPRERDQLGRWLGWLDWAGAQQRVSFYGNSSEMLDAFARGDLAWIACRSRHLAHLRGRLGLKLGVAPLPSGPGGQASPIARLRVWAFGINSSPEQKRISKALAQFTLNPLIQRAATLHNNDLLPVNRHVNVPVTSSRVLAVLQKGMEQSMAYGLFNANLLVGEPHEQILRDVLTSMLFGALDADQARELLIRQLGALK